MTDPDRTPELGSRYPGEGFHVEPDFRYPSGEAEYVPDGTAQYALPATEQTTTQRVVSAAELDDVFDDPDDGELGRDSLGLHWVWETLLLLACIGLGFVIANGRSHAFSDTNIRSLMLAATVLGATALAAGLSLRANAVNLAIGPIMVISGLYFAEHVRDGLVPAVAVSLAIATGIGLAIGVIVVGLHVPAWAVSLGAFIGLQLWIKRLPIDLVIEHRYHIDRQAYYWYGAFAAIALIGGVLGALHAIRRSVSRFRPTGDPADRRGTQAAVMTALMLAGSGLLAGLAGVASALFKQEFITSNGLEITGFAIGVALIAGTSAFGRRGGVFGTILATSLITLLLHYFDVANFGVDPLLVIVSMIGAGLILTRVVETIGRPQRPESEDVTTSSWLRRQQGSWTDQLPVRTTEVGFESSDERWGTRA